MESETKFHLPFPNLAFTSVNPMCLMPWIYLPNSLEKTDTESPLKKTKYNRTWKRKEVELLYSTTRDFCIRTGKEIDKLDYNDYNEIAKYVNKPPKQCMSKIHEVITSGTLRPGIWSEPEDERLKQLLGTGKKKWGELANILNNELHKGIKIRTGKQCKERWNNHLNPQINRGIWTPVEDLMLLEAHKKLGNRWSLIAKELNTRTESSIKNRVKSLLNQEKQELDSLDLPGQALDRLIMRKKIEAEQLENLSTESKDFVIPLENYK
ncbi:unnamed protein product [Blepharisma stoltei]|uniref:Myb-like DNA-binding domain containing protein n=1 Tax=Blepharisma stoltei TaxID=1481888 RepID=A0AAU9IFM2_9CILI|nr:unnamed protein product [Blepharisma stoltei]